MENPIEPSINSLFEELKSRVRKEGIVSFEAYMDIVDDLIMEKLDDGYFSQDEDLVQTRLDLEQRWPEIEAEIKEDTPIY